MKYTSETRSETDPSPLEHTTNAVVIRGMRGMSSMGKPVSMRPMMDANSVFLGGAKQPSAPPLNEFVCTCATGWTGPTCEISKYI